MNDAETDKLWDDLIHDLEGTCGDLPEEHEGLWNSKAFCARVDARIFQCEKCEWWMAISEMGADGLQRGICVDCVEEDE